VHEVTISEVMVNSKGKEKFIYHDTEADGI